MKKFLPFLVFGLLMVSFLGCGSSGSGGGTASVVGTWSWTEQQTQPAPQQYTGSLNVTNLTGTSMSGTVIWLSPNSGGPFNFSGTLNGNSATLMYTWGATIENWIITFNGNTFSGTWTAGGLAGTVSGTKN